MTAEKAKEEESGPQTIEPVAESTKRIHFSHIRALRTAYESAIDPESRTLREIGENQARAKQIMESETIFGQPYLKEGRQIEIVSDISGLAARPCLVRTAGLVDPSPLVYAVKHQVLECIRRQGWWEALDKLELSESGEHALYMEGGKGEHPHLLACARLLGVDPANAENNLFRSKFFRSEEWKPRAGREQFREAIQNSYPVERVNFEAVPSTEELRNLAELEEGLIRAIGPERMTEIVRLSFDMNALFSDPNLFLDAMIEISGEIAESGRPFAFATVESPIYGRLTKIEALTRRKCFLSLSRHKIEDETDRKYTGTTHKLLLFNRNIAEGGRLMKAAQKK